jgi:hypothetical protein
MATVTPLPHRADDPVKVAPRHYKVEFENERVRVLRITYGPGEKSPMHGHPEAIVTFLTKCHFRFTYPDGKTEDIKVPARAVKHFECVHTFTRKPEQFSIRGDCG